MMIQSEQLTFFVLENQTKHPLLGIKEYKVNIENDYVDNLNISRAYVKDLIPQDSKIEIQIKAIYIKNKAIEIIESNAFKNKILSYEINISNHSTVVSDFVIEKFSLQEEVQKEKNFLLTLKQTKILHLK